MFIIQDLAIQRWVRHTVCPDTAPLERWVSHIVCPDIVPLQRWVRHFVCPKEVKNLVDVVRPMTTIQCRVSAKTNKNTLKKYRERLEDNFQYRGNQEVLLRKRYIRISVSRDKLGYSQ